jgi:long-chain acyl-CoA synthetase
MPGSIVHGLQGIARRSPDLPALSWRTTRWTYADLLSAIDAVRTALIDRQVPRGARIALLLKNSPHYVALYYGTLAAGCVAVPLNAQERAAALARQIEHCGAALVIADSSHPEWSGLRDRVLALPSPAAVLGVTLHDGPEALALWTRELGADNRELPIATLADQDLAAIIYTSGTTGRPKGVMLSHGNLAANTAAIIEYLQLSSADRGLCVLPFHFSYGNSVLHTHLLAGAHLFIEENFAFPQPVLQRMQQEAITGFAGVPSTFALMLGRCKVQDFDLAALRYVTQAGGAMPRFLLEQLRRELPHVELFTMYGQTEATARLTYLPPARLVDKAGSVGIPIAGVQIDVRRDGRSLALRASGEVHVRGPNVMLGYWNDPAATAQVLSEGWLNTGDLGYRDEDGYLYLEGRSVEMIKVGAFRIAPQEIEEVIGALPGVAEVAVTGVADELLGQAIKAVIVTRDGEQIDARAIKAYCRERLATYKIPKVLEFVAELPRTSSGKVQRYKLTSGVV